MTKKKAKRIRRKCKHPNMQAVFARIQGIPNKVFFCPDCRRILTPDEVGKEPVIEPHQTISKSIPTALSMNVQPTAYQPYYPMIPMPPYPQYGTPEQICPKQNTKEMIEKIYDYLEMLKVLYAKEQKREDGDEKPVKPISMELPIG